ncbi:MAG: N-acetylglucosaminyl-diphospho-decaprenol L-rhamnosyltransferase [Planctomycetota bacterium]
MDFRDKPRLSIIIVNYDSWGELMPQVSQWLSTPEFQTGLIELIVVDNHSPTPAPQERSQRSGLIWIDHHENVGFAAGVNIGWKHAQGSWILIANPDLVITKSHAKQILALLDKLDSPAKPITQQKIGIIGVSLTNPDGSRQPSVGIFPTMLRAFIEFLLPRKRRRYQIVSPEKFSVVDWVTGAFFLVRSQTMQELNGFDTDYFLYFEETDFCQRSRSQGWLTSFAPEIQVCHLKPLQNRSISPMIRFWTRHSRLLYFQKNRPRREFLMMLMLIRTEAIVKYHLAKWGIGAFPAEIWWEVRKLADEFAENRFPVGVDVRIRAEKILKNNSKS